MTLEQMLRGIADAAVTGSAGLEITGLTYDSRKVKPGVLFAALRGGKVDGRKFIPDALRSGAAAILCERDEEAAYRPMIVEGVALVEADDAREAFARAAVNFFSHPSDALCVLGITGTNGKTTTSYILKTVLETWGKKVGLIGTIRYLIGDKGFNAPHTTPEASDFQELLRRMHREGCTHVVSEVSSHALAQKRVFGTLFRSAVFTNLTRDHLDFHKGMEEYFSEKGKLFRTLLASDGNAVINADDPYGKKLAASLRLAVPKMRTVTFGLDRASDLMATRIANSVQGLRFTLRAGEEEYLISSPLLGLPNVYNILSAAGAARGVGVPWDVIVEGVRRAGTVPGRFETIDEGQKFLAVVDYAHTEDALERLIYTARGISTGKVITVFGCGGDRDTGKRPRMGAIATRLSDFVVVTSDNPRSEPPDRIIDEIVAGAARKNFLVEPDRKEAIRRAVLLASDGDILLVAGKGHETYQEIGAKRFDFNDRAVLEEAIRLIAGKRESR